jgi:AraC-like DNA-binding protein
MATARALYCSSDMYFAELTCAPDDPEWGEENLVTHPIVALPATPVWQVHDGAPTTLVNANHAVFHHAGSEYHRDRFQDGGYRCLFFFPSETLVRQIAGELDPGASSTPSYRFPASTAPLYARSFALARRLALRLSEDSVDALAAREGLYKVLRSVILNAYGERPPRRAARRATERAHVEIVEAAKASITGSLESPFDLDDLVGELHISAYHLARVFRSFTGYSLHSYRLHLRLREGLDRLERRPWVTVGQIGGELGFSSHSHFTASFHKTLGFRPSEVRRRPDSEVSTHSTA